jgi:hypothetical protein
MTHEAGAHVTGCQNGAYWRWLGLLECTGLTGVDNSGAKKQQGDDAEYC